MKAVSILQFHQSDKPFIISVKTDNAGTSNNDQFTIPTTGTGYNYSIKTSEHNLTGQTGSVTLTFASAGTYDIEISGDFPRIYFDNTGDKLKLMTIEQWGSVKWTSFSRSFMGCANMTGNFIDVPDLSNVTEMDDAFYGNASFNSNIGNWDFSNITTMYRTFNECTLFNNGGSSDIDNLNVGNVTNFFSTFNKCYAFNQPIGSWNVISATTMNQMLGRCTSFDQNIGSWDVRNVADFTLFLYIGTLSTTNYDALLTGWYALPSLQLNCNFHGGNSKYTTTGQTAKNNIITDYNWSFTDGGLQV